MLGDGSMDLMHHSHSFNASVVPVTTMASFPLTSCVAPCAPYRCLNIKKPTRFAPAGLLFSVCDWDAFVSVKQNRDLLNYHSKPAIRQRKKWPIRIVVAPPVVGV